MSEEKRIECVDITKGLAIIVVVVSHLVMIPSVGDIVTRLFGGLMGVFFMLSSYFYKPGKGYLYNVKRRFFQVLVPFLVYNLVVLILCFIYETVMGLHPEVMDYLNIYWGRLYDTSSFTAINLAPYTGAPRAFTQTVVHSIASNAVIPSWFLHRMFFSELIFFAIADWALKNVKRVAGTIFGLLSITVLYTQFFKVHLPLQLDSCFAIAAVMLFGSYMRQIDCAAYIENHPWDKKKTAITAVFLALYVVGAIYLSDFYGRALIMGMFGTIGSLSVYIWFFCQVIFFYVMLFFASLIAHVPFLSEPLKLVGKHTLMILLFHLFFGIVVGQLLTLAFGYETKPVWISWVSVVSALGLSLLVSMARDSIKAIIAK